MSSKKNAYLKSYNTFIENNLALIKGCITDF